MGNGHGQAHLIGLEASLRRCQKIYMFEKRRLEMFLVNLL
jgi:hypothetical protein